MQTRSCGQHLSPFTHWLTYLAFVAGVVFGSPASAENWIYSTRPGDNLWNLSEEFLIRGVADTERLRKFNRIDDPYHILPGTRIKFPLRWLKVQPTSAHLIKLQGEVKVRQAAGGTLVAATPGVELRAGDAIVTGPGGSGTIEFADGSRLVVQEKSFLALDQLSAYGHTGMVDTSLRLPKGRVESEVTPAKGPGSRFNITTPAAVAAVRGTRFRVGYHQDKELGLSEVEEGGLVVSSGRVQRAIPAGFGIAAKAGQPLPKREALLPPPILLQPGAVVERLVTDVVWKPMVGAIGYRVQLFEGDTLTKDRRVAGASVELETPPDGRYVLRVRAIATSQLEGQTRVQPIEVNARPVPPGPLGPAANHATYGMAPELWWSVPTGAQDFRLQLARSADFKDLLIDEFGLTNPRYQPKLKLAPGHYYWRTATRATTGETGPFADARTFRMQVVPAAPKAEPPKVAEGKVNLTWGRGGERRAL